MSGESLLRDELAMKNDLYIVLDDDELWLWIEDINLNIHERYGQRSVPKQNSLNMTENDYQKFLGELSMSLYQIEEHLNEVTFRDPIPMYQLETPEFYKGVMFWDHAMYIELFVEEEYKIYEEKEEEEDEEWDDGRHHHVESSRPNRKERKPIRQLEI